MIIKTLNRSEAQNAMKEWVLNYPSLPEVEGDYLKIRKDIQEFNQKVRSECPDTIAKKDYYIDAHIGILLYDYLWRVPGFNLRAAANDDFWRYLSIKVIPDVVAERWGYEKYGSEYMAISGCGPTSLAMVVVGLTGNTNINPKVIAEFSEENGYVVDGVGSAWTLMSDGAENFGLRSEELPLSEDSIIDTLKSGQPIIASMGPGTFTTSGHFVVLTGVDKNNRIIINDSDSKIRSEQTWDVDVFMKEADNLWTFTVM